MNRYMEEIERIKRQIIEMYNPEKIILFGSSARNELSDDSDIDILVIKQTQKSKFDRMCELRRMIDYTIPLDLLVYTPDEIHFARQQENDFISTIFSEGVVLYEQ